MTLIKNVLFSLNIYACGNYNSHVCQLTVVILCDWLDWSFPFDLRSCLVCKHGWGLFLGNPWGLAITKVSVVMLGQLKIATGSHETPLRVLLLVVLSKLAYTVYWSDVIVLSLARRP